MQRTRKNRTSKKNKIRQRIGREKGNQVENVEKSWVMERKKDGSFTLQFTTKENDVTDTFVETGKCWTEKGKFYEYHENSQKTDIYTYEVLNENQIKFKMINSAIEFNSDGPYEFIDTRDSEAKIALSTYEENNANADGLSIETAIKVKNIKEEYTYVRENCADCNVLGQALLFEKNKPYDRLDAQKPDGSKISYYFDISSFFGKF
ncbi:hypothetical protein [Flavobacterium adhaerens]|uniref:hypothetical protein n=1 Tax=Flavobacterium adhaerens TaxID=3149043 RepID=UPI0032B5E658